MNIINRLHINAHISAHYYHSLYATIATILSLEPMQVDGY